MHASVIETPYFNWDRSLPSFWFPEFILQPINFDALYAHGMAQAQAQAQKEPTGGNGSGGNGGTH